MEDQQPPFAIELCKFSVENIASLREPTSISTAILLCNNFCVDGFASSAEPVQIRLEDMGALNQALCSNNLVASGN